MSLPVTLRVNLTKDHITRGLPLRARQCPLALAVHDVLPDNVVSVLPKVDGWVVTVYDKNGCRLLGEYHVESNVGQCISEYDKTKMLAPTPVYLVLESEYNHAT